MELCCKVLISGEYTPLLKDPAKHRASEGGKITCAAAFLRGERLISDLRTQPVCSYGSESPETVPQFGKKNLWETNKNLLQRNRNLLLDNGNLLQRNKNLLLSKQNLLLSKRNLLQRNRNLLQRKRNLLETNGYCLLANVNPIATNGYLRTAM